MAKKRPDPAEPTPDLPAEGTAAETVVAPPEETAPGLRLPPEPADDTAVVAALMQAAVPKPARRCRVSVPGTHVPPVEVVVPGGAADVQTKAIEMAKAKLGVWSFGAGPVVEVLD